MSLGDLNYLSLLQYSDVVIGNSSSGIIEVPYFKKPTVNIGNRQRNRLRSSSIIDCQANAKEIIDAISKSLSNEFKEVLKNSKLAYMQDDSSKKIIEIIKKTDLTKIMMKKFNDLPAI